jgi:hypothetical protein
MGYVGGALFIARAHFVRMFRRIRQGANRRHLYGSDHNSCEISLEFEKVHVVLDNDSCLCRSSRTACRCLSHSHDKEFYDLVASTGGNRGFLHHVWMHKTGREGDDPDSAPGSLTEIRGTYLEFLPLLPQVNR